MLMKKIVPMLRLLYPAIAAVALLTSCNRQTAPVTDEPVEAVSPVQVTSIEQSSLTAYTELTAVSTYQQKSYVKANVNGYIQFANAIIGKEVQAGTVLFKLITKEARAIGNSVNRLDPGLRFSGVSSISADQAGFITAISHQKGDYVQDGEALAVISNQNSFVFLLDLPYELHSLLNNHQTVMLSLPDGEKLSGTITGSLPAVDSVAQTQRMVIRVNPTHPIPEGLIAKVKISKASNPNAQVLPKSAVLTNETEDEFWVMKLINDSTAIKVIVKKGIENERLVEILSPIFNATDRIISIGNYGIADTAKVKIMK